MGYIIASSTIGKCSRAFTLATDQVLDILEALNDKGMTIMTVTHDPRVAVRAKKVIYIRDGEIAGGKELPMGSNRAQVLEGWLKSV